MSAWNDLCVQIKENTIMIDEDDYTLKRMIMTQEMDDKWREQDYELS